MSSWYFGKSSVAATASVTALAISGMKGTLLLARSRTENRVGAGFLCGADDRVRTGDLNLGKVALYQLSYVRNRLLMLALRCGFTNRKAHSQLRRWERIIGVDRDRGRTDNEK